MSRFKTIDMPCPECAFPWLKLSLGFKAGEIGEFSLAGMQVKLSATQVPHLECGNSGCDWELCGEINHATNEALFSREAWS